MANLTSLNCVSLKKSSLLAEFSWRFPEITSGRLCLPPAEKEPPQRTEQQTKATTASNTSSETGDSFFAKNENFIITSANKLIEPYANPPIHPYISFSKENTDKGGQKDDETQILEAEALQFTRCIYHFQKLDKDEA